MGHSSEVPPQPDHYHINDKNKYKHYHHHDPGLHDDDKRHNNYFSGFDILYGPAIYDDD